MREVIPKGGARARRQPRKAARVRQARGVTKLAVSFEPALAKRITGAAARTTKGNVSAWLAKAAEAELRHDGLEQWLDEYEAKHGTFTGEELEASRRRLGW